MNDGQSVFSKVEVENLVQRFALGQGDPKEEKIFFDLIRKNSEVADLYRRTVLEFGLIERAIGISRGEVEEAERIGQSSSSDDKDNPILSDAIEEFLRGEREVVTKSSTETSTSPSCGLRSSDSLEFPPCPNSSEESGLGEENSGKERSVKLRLLDPSDKWSDIVFAISKNVIASVASTSSNTESDDLEEIRGLVELSLSAAATDAQDQYLLSYAGDAMKEVLNDFRSCLEEPAPDERQDFGGLLINVLDAALDHVESKGISEKMQASRVKLQFQLERLYVMSGMLDMLSGCPTASANTPPAKQLEVNLHAATERQHDDTD